MTRAYRRLCAALLLRAAKDAQARDPLLASEARDFLATEGANLAQELGFDPDVLGGWLGDLDPVAYRQLALSL